MGSSPGPGLAPALNARPAGAIFRYIYFAMAFALLVELLNMRLRKVHKPLHLHAGERGAPRNA